MTAVESHLVWIPAFNWSYPRTFPWCFSVTRKKCAVDVERNSERLFGVYPQLEVVLSRRCQVIFLWVWQQLWKHVGVWRKCSSSVNSVPPLLRDTQEADSSLNTAPYFLNSSVTDKRSHREKAAQITPTTIAVIFSSSYHIRRQIFSESALNATHW